MIQITLIRRRPRHNKANEGQEPEAVLPGHLDVAMGGPPAPVA
jgi:hypothetical protein